jgi:hypothetical protein
MHETGNGATGEPTGDKRGGDGLCHATAKDGRPCRAPALRGEDRCYMHSPRTAQERREASRRGGSTTSARRRLLLGHLTFSDLSDIREGRQALAAAVIQGSVTPPKATVVAGLLRDAEGALIQYAMSDRLDALEAAIERLTAARSWEGRS